MTTPRRYICPSAETEPSKSHNFILNQNKKEIFIVDTGAAIARRLQQLLAQHDLLKPALNAESPSEDKKQVTPLEVWTTGTQNTLQIALGYIKEESVPVQVCPLPT